MFFKDRLKQINEMSDYSYSVIDRHMIDDFLFPDTLIEMKYFNKKTNSVLKILIQTLL
ncbi:hypothetical protein [Mycoplasmopsis felis]|uniref:hypothetical protein n=1 Tax=Mycoplasmopsis felis TaxID=33923 RepID=UPI002AFF1DF5|nr:hypothetical protein [Mycoplasmopsis felis]WQQ02990.1 hypothetical protein RRG38_02430 [Mycoplasmopsis felis]